MKSERSRMRTMAGLEESLSGSSRRLYSQNGLILKVGDDIAYNLISMHIPSEPNGETLTKLPSESLHVTLTRLTTFNKILNSKDFDSAEIDIPSLRLGNGKFVYRSESGKVSYVIPLLNQEEMSRFVNKLYALMGEENPEPNRFYHITLANNLGGDSFSYIGDVSKEDFAESLDEKRSRSRALAGIKNSGVQVWFDLDGVLANMQNALEQDEKYLSLKNDLDNALEDRFSRWLTLSNDELKVAINNAVTESPNDVALLKLKKMYKNYNNYIFSVASRPNFYFTMDLMPGAMELVDSAYRITGVRPNILSSPVGNENDKKNLSVIEKKRWVYKNFESKMIYLAQKYLGDIIGKMVHKVFGNTVGIVEITSDKARVIRSERDVLIDDRVKYVDKFREAGGSAILYINSDQAAAELKSLYDRLNSEQ